METGGPEAASSGQEVVGVSQEEKTHALLSWVLMIVISFVSPLIFLLIDKDKPFVYRHAAQGLAYCIGVTVAAIVLWIIAFVLALVFAPLALLMIPIWIGIIVLNIYVIVMGAINANKGLPFDPPVTSAIARSLFKV
jgi:uncharacterized membrane protein